MRGKRLCQLRVFVSAALRQHLSGHERGAIWEAVQRGSLAAARAPATEAATTADHITHALRPKELQLLHWLWTAHSRNNPQAKHYMHRLLTAVHSSAAPLPLVWRLALMRGSLPPFRGGGGDDHPELALEEEEREYIVRGLPTYAPDKAPAAARHEPEPKRAFEQRTRDVAQFLSGLSLPWLEGEGVWEEARKRAYRGAQEGSRQIVRDVVAPIAKQKLFEQARLGAKLGVKAGVEEGARQGALEGAHEGIRQGMEQGLAEDDVLEALSKGAWAGASASATAAPPARAEMRCIGRCPQCEDRRCNNPAKVYLTYNANPRAYRKQPLRVGRMHPQFSKWLDPLLADGWARTSKTDTRDMIALCTYCHQLIVRNLRMYYPAQYGT